MGFTRVTIPAVSTLHEVFCRLDTETFEVALAQWNQQWLATTGAGVVIALAELSSSFKIGQHRSPSPEC